MQLVMNVVIARARASQLLLRANSRPARLRADACGSCKTAAMALAKLVGSSGSANRTSFSDTICLTEGRFEATIGVPLARYSKSLTGDVSVRDASTFPVLDSTNTSAARKYTGTRSCG